MPLSDQQLEEMYKRVIKDNTNISWMRENLEKGGKKFEEHEKRIRRIETEESLLKAKIGAVVIFLTLCVTIVINSFGWFIAHFWGR